MYQQARIVDEWGVGADGQGRSVLGGWVICLRLCRYYGIFGYLPKIGQRLPGCVRCTGPTAVLGCVGCTKPHLAVQR